MRRIAAHIAFTGREYIHRPLIELSNCGEVQSIKQFAPDKGEPAGTEFFSGMLVPGFVNAHTHLELSYLDQTYNLSNGLIDFVSHVISCRRNLPNPTISQLKQKLRYMHACGTVAFADICNSLLSFSVKSDIGMKSKSFFEFFALSESQIIEQIDVFLDAREKFPGVYPAFHAPYSMDENCLDRLETYFRNLNYSSLHFRESQEEMDLNSDDNLFKMFYRKINPDFNQAFNYGKWIDSQGEFLRDLNNLLLVHNVFLSEKEEMELNSWAQKYNVNLSFVLCPRSNMNIVGTLPDVMMLKNKGVNLCLGTDSLLSVDTLSVFDEMKYMQRNYSELKFSELLKMATFNGAVALGWQDELGEIAPGKRPGINGIIMKNLHDDYLCQDAELIRLV